MEDDLGCLSLYIYIVVIYSMPQCHLIFIVRKIEAVNNHLAWREPNNNYLQNDHQHHLASKTGNYLWPQLLAQHSSYVSNIQFGSLSLPSQEKMKSDRQSKAKGGPGRSAGKLGEDGGRVGPGRLTGRLGKDGGRLVREAGGPGRKPVRPSRDSLLTAALLDMTQPAGMLTDNSLMDSEGRSPPETKIMKNTEKR